MSARGKARRRALDILFEAELRDQPATSVLAERVERAEPPVNEYTTALVEGVHRNRVRIDELISTYSEGWTLDRMPAVDRNLARIAVYEMLHRDDIDDVVAISEAVGLAEELSTDESPKFLNGVLGRIAEHAVH